MNVKDFHKYIKQPELLNASTVAELQEVLEVYPYFQTAHILYLKSLYNQNNFKFNDQLKFSSVHINNRKNLLFFLKEQDSTVKEPTLKQTTEVKAQAKEDLEVKKNVKEISKKELEKEETVLEIATSKTLEKKVDKTKTEEALEVKKQEDFSANPVKESLIKPKETEKKKLEEKETPISSIFKEQKIEPKKTKEKETEIKQKPVKETLSENKEKKEIPEKKVEKPKSVKEKSVPQKETITQPNIKKVLKSSNSEKKDKELTAQEILKKRLEEISAKNKAVKTEQKQVLGKKEPLKETKVVVSKESPKKAEVLKQDKTKQFDKIQKFIEKSGEAKQTNKANLASEDLLDISGLIQIEAPSEYLIEEKKDKRTNKESFSYWANRLKSKEKSKKTEIVDAFLANKESKIVRATKDKKYPVVKEKSEKDSDVSLMTETLAKIYTKQGHYEKAILAYEKLSLKNPKKNAFFASQIEKIKKLKISGENTQD